MKGFRSTGVLAVLVALLAGYTFWEYKHAAEDEQQERGEKRLFQLVRDDLEQIEFSAKGQTALLKKAGTLWRLEKPVDDDADSSAVEGFIYSLLTQKGKLFRGEDEKDTKWSEYGLEPPGSMVEVRGKGQTEKLEVSSKHAFDGSFYIRSKNLLLLGDRGLSQLVERDPNSFRSRKIYRGPEDVIEVQVTAQVDGGTEVYSLKKTEDKEKNVWTMMPAPKFSLDSNKVTVWLQKLVGLNATEFAAETLSDADKKSFLLEKPSLVVKMGDSLLTFGQSRADDIFVTTNKRSTVYKTAASAIDQVRVPKSYFRDGHEPFKFNLERVQSVTVQTDKFARTFVKKDSTWSLDKAGKDEELDSDKLVSLFQNLQSLEAQEFLSKGEGLPATPQIVLKGSDGKPIFALTWGSEYKSPHAYYKTSAFRYVRAQPGEQIFAVQKDKLDRLIDSAMIKKKESKASENH